jgi:hypothetical protein
MPAWREARRSGSAAESRHGKLSSEYKDVYKPRYPATTGKCYCCGARRRLRTGRIGGIAILFCPEHEDAYRKLREFYA